MSIQAMSAVWDLPRDLLPSSHRFVLLSYANHANRYGQHSYPGYATVADETGLSEPTVWRATKALVGLGMLEAVARPGRDPKTQRFTGSVVYNVILPGLKVPKEEQLPLQGDPARNGAALHLETRPVLHLETRDRPAVDQPGDQPGSQAANQTVLHHEGVTDEPLTAETVNGFQLFESKNEELVGRLREKGHIQ